MVLVHTERYFQRHLDEIRAQLADYDLLEVGPSWIEIMPKNVNKASALQHIAEENGFTLDEVIAVTDTNEQQGIAKALSRYLFHEEYKG